MDEDPYRTYAHYDDEVGESLPIFGQDGDFDYSNIEPDGWQENCWTIISAYFDEKGLVRQQLDSFDEFVTVSIQRIVEEHPVIELMAEADYYSMFQNDCFVSGILEF